MLFEKWMNTVLGKSINLDGVSGFQCVDVVHSYLKDCWGIPVTARGNAKDYVNALANDKTLSKYFRKVSNTPSLVLNAGDIVVWDYPPYGHVAISTGKGDTKYFYSIDQNWNGKKAVETVKHNFTNVACVLRPKKEFINKIFQIIPPFKRGDILSLLDYIGVYNSSLIRKRVKELTGDGKANATSKNLNTMATLNKGTRVTVCNYKWVDGNCWIEIPSGWILVYHKNSREWRAR